jgi:hypothetical protein
MLRRSACSQIARSSSPSGSPDGDVQARGHPADGGLGERVCERVDQRVTASPVAGAHATQVAIQLAAGQRVGERVLLDARGPAIGEDLLADDGLQPCTPS